MAHDVQICPHFVNVENYNAFVILKYFSPKDQTS